MMEPRRTLGQEITRKLAGMGVRTIFGIPGVHNVELYRGMAETGIRHVLARHEQGVGFMADGYARATGEPGVGFVISGPGLTNIMTPMGQAYSDSVPMLVISSGLEPGDEALGFGRLHEMRDQAGAARCVCDWSEEAPDPATAYALIERAFAEFAAGSRLPKHIQVPIGALGAPAPPAPENRPPDPGLPGPAAEVLDMARGLIERSNRPLCIFGGGGAGAAGPARAFAEELQAVSITTYAGAGVIPRSGDLCLGSCLPRPESVEAIQSADLVIAVGTRLSEVDLWRGELGHDCPMIRIDLNPRVLADRFRAECPILSDASKALQGLLAGRRRAGGWTVPEIRDLKARFLSSSEAGRPGIASSVSLFREALPAEALVYSDMTQFAYVAKEIFELPEPGLWHHPYGFGTLGYALPAAIGAKAALPDRPVAAVAGDYGFQYTMQELGVAAELGLSLPVVIWDNGSLREIHDCMVEAQIEPFAVAARNPDFLKLAGAYGARAFAPSSADEFVSVLRESLEASGPTLIRLVPGIGRGAGE